MGPWRQGSDHQCRSDLRYGPGRAQLRFVEHTEEQKAAFSSLGLDLRAVRQSKGLEISQVSSSLKISKRHLSAIEEGDVSALPLGDVYLIGYTRAYASYLGVNVGQWAERLKAEIAEREARRLLNTAQMPIPENGLSSAVRRTLSFLGVL